ncbi:hypothetical protein X975_24254, partial [Stegodyphus mimosarum]
MKYNICMKGHISYSKKENVLNVLGGAFLCMSMVFFLITFHNKLYIYNIKRFLF